MPCWCLHCVRFWLNQRWYRLQTKRLLLLLPRWLHVDDTIVANRRWCDHVANDVRRWRVMSWRYCRVVAVAVNDSMDFADRPMIALARISCCWANALDVLVLWLVNRRLNCFYKYQWKESKFQLVFFNSIKIDWSNWVWIFFWNVSISAPYEWNCFSVVRNPPKRFCVIVKQIVWSWRTRNNSFAIECAQMMVHRQTDWWHRCVWWLHMRRWRCIWVCAVQLVHGRCANRRCWSSMMFGRGRWWIWCYRISTGVCLMINGWRNANWWFGAISVLRRSWRRLFCQLWRRQITIFAFFCLHSGAAWIFIARKIARFWLSIFAIAAAAVVIFQCFGRF